MLSVKSYLAVVTSWVTIDFKGHHGKSICCPGLLNFSCGKRIFTHIFFCLVILAMVHLRLTASTHKNAYFCLEKDRVRVAVMELYPEALSPAGYKEFYALVALAHKAHQFKKEISP